MSRTPTNKSIGDRGEDLAVFYLENKGYTILERNYRFEHAEVDIVAYDDREIIFVEVKTRKNADFGEPEEYVDDAKITRICKAAEAWLYERNMVGSPARFDVIAIISERKTKHRIKHFENAFEFQ